MAASKVTSAAAFAMARGYIRREWDNDETVMIETARRGLSGLDKKVLVLRYGKGAGEVGRALIDLCERDLASRAIRPA